jgi:hypothetical protein
MRKFRAAMALMVLAACGGGNRGAPQVSKEPISVRGWIADVEGLPQATYRTVETDAARRMQLFQSTNVWVENAPYVSGGVAENGAFLLLDVPPGNITITFSAPGAPAANLVLQNVPGNADVYAPAILLKRDSVALLDPKSVTVRLAAGVAQPKPTGSTAVVAGLKVPVMITPIGQMADRHEYPRPPSGAVPLATVK